MSDKMILNFDSAYLPERQFKYRILVRFPFVGTMWAHLAHVRAFSAEEALLSVVNPELKPVRCQEYEGAFWKVQPQYGAPMHFKKTKEVHENF